MESGAAHQNSVQRQTQCAIVKIPFSFFRFQKREISSPLFSSPLIRAIRLIRGSQSSHFLKRM